MTKGLTGFTRRPMRWRLAVALTTGLAGAASLGPVGRASADVAMLTPTKDNTLYQDVNGLLSNGKGTYCFVGVTGNGDRRRTLMAFDVAASIPAGATINGVTLRLNMSKTNAAAPSTPVSLHRVTKDWGEGASNAASPNEGDGAPAAPNDATWKHTFFSSQLWTALGGDFSSTASGAAFVGGLGAYTWTSTPQMVTDVQSWLDAPTGNFGWILIGTESGTTTAKRFDTRENLVVANQPLLTIDYTPDMVPTLPTSWGSIKAAYR